MRDYDELAKRINGMFKVCTDMVKTDPFEILTEQLDDAYNRALIDVLLLIKPVKCERREINPSKMTKI